MMKWLFRPIDGAILIYFRFFAGLFLSFELINSLSLGDFDEYSAPFHFTYMYLEWIKPWPKTGLVIHYFLTILAGFTFALGYRQRLSAIILFFGNTLLFLMEKSEYINHLYLYCLLSFWLIWLPQKKGDKIVSPAWYYYLMLFHISVVYFFAGVAKINPDWISGNAVNVMLGKKSEWSQFLAYGGLFFDLFIVPLLLWKRTRVPAFLAACFFHISNVVNFGLATFPWFSLMMTTLFFGASWPRKFTWFDDFFPETSVGQSPHKGIAFAVGVYCLLQILIPLRMHLYKGNPSWTENGHQFSWRMKLRDKKGDVRFYVVDKETNKVRIVSPEKHLTKKQYRNMIGKPDFILEFAHHLKKKYGNVKVHASSRVSLNGAPKREMVNIKTDLATEKRSLEPYSWVLE